MYFLDFVNKCPAIRILFFVKYKMAIAFAGNNRQSIFLTECSLGKWRATPDTAFIKKQPGLNGREYFFKHTGRLNCP